MERIVRLNAIENLCQSGILGMNQHSLHPGKNLASEKLTISGISFTSEILAFLNTSNQKYNTLFMCKAVIGNRGLLNVFLQKLSHLVLSCTITFAMILAGGGARKIARVKGSHENFFLLKKFSWVPVTRVIKEAELWVVKARKLRLPKIVRREQIKAGDIQAFYDR